MSIETRSFPLSEIRADEKMVVGHAATFDEPYTIGDFEEVIAPGAFRNTLKEPQWVAIWNHNSDNVLGRPPDTARAKEDDTGLYVEIDLPQTAVREREAIERGDVKHMSFGFSVVKETWAKRDDKPDLRTLEEVILYDASPTPYPANPNTDIAVRSREAWQAKRAESELEARDREEWAASAKREADRHREWLENHTE